MTHNLTFANYQRAASLFAWQLQASDDPEASALAIGQIIADAEHRGELAELPLAVVIVALNAAPQLCEHLSDFKAHTVAGALAVSKGADWVVPDDKGGDGDA